MQGGTAKPRPCLGRDRGFYMIRSGREISTEWYSADAPLSEGSDGGAFSFMVSDKSGWHRGKPPLGEESLFQGRFL